MTYQELLERRHGVYVLDIGLPTAADYHLASPTLSSLPDTRVDVRIRETKEISVIRVVRPHSKDGANSHDNTTEGDVGGENRYRCS